jgi:glutaredoxin 3
MAAEVKIYTRQWCGYCSAATRFLSQRGVKFEEIDVTGDAATRKWLAETTGQSTVPQIFIDGKPIGGYTDMRALDDMGRLDALLAGGEQAASETR